MKHILAYLCIAIFIITPGLVYSVDGTGNAMVESIRFLGATNGVEVIHFKLNEELVPKVFELSGENPRVVFDFVKAGYPAKGKKVIRAGGRFVKRIRVGRHREPVAKTRVVIDLASEKEFEIEKEFLLAKKILEVKVVLKVADVAIEPVVSEPNKEEETKVTEQVVEKTVVKEQTIPSSTAIVEDTAPPPAAKVEETVIKEGKDLIPQEVPIAVKKDPVPLAAEASEKILATNPLEDDQIVSPETTRDPPALVKVSYENTTNKKEMVLFRLNGFHPPVIFAIEEEEPRIVCDFLDVNLGAKVRQLLNSDGEYIRRVRVAKHSNPNKVRVVLDLVANNNYDLKQVFFKEDNLFVVIISNLE